MIFTFAAFVRLPAPPAKKNVAMSGLAPGLVLTRVDAMGSSDTVGERLRLFDPTPLFLPVSWDGFMPKSEVLRDTSRGEVLALFSTRLRYENGGELTRILAPAVPTPLSAAVEIAGTRWFGGLARTFAEITASAVGPAVARIKVFRFGTGEQVLDKAFEVDTELAENIWGPLKVMLLVNEVGVVGSPSIIAGSGIDEIDEKFRALLGHEWGRALRLRPGNYRLEISL